MNPFIDRPAPVAPRRTWGQRLVLVFNLVLISLSLAVASLLGYANDRAASINRVALDRSLTELPEVERGERVLNVLLVGSDSSANLDPDDPIQIGRQGERLGDVIIIAHLDERSGKVALLSLPRDLWVPIAGSDREDRINRAFLLGGPATLIETIETSLGIPIHHYVNVDFAGFQGLVEAVGTVDVYFETPARDWNVNAVPEPRSQTGFIVTEPGCHALDPEQALAYVRSRYYQTQDADGNWITDPSSDLGRIRRQQDFLQRLMQTAIDLGARNPLVLGDLIDTGVQHVAIDQDLTPSLLIDLGNSYRSFEPGDLQTYTYPVTDGTVGSKRVLLPLTDTADPLVNLFSGEPFDGPDTVAVDVVYDGSTSNAQIGPAGVSPAVEVAAEILDEAGFDVGSPAEGDIGTGLVIRHGPDGRHAAEVVASALAGHDDLDELGAPRFEELPGLGGRTVSVAVGEAPSAPQLGAELAFGRWVDPASSGWPAERVQPSTDGGTGNTATAGDADSGNADDGPVPSGPSADREAPDEPGGAVTSPPVGDAC